MCGAGVIGDLGMKAVVVDDILTATGVLQTLHLRGCHLKAEAFEALGIGMAACYTLKELRCVADMPGIDESRRGDTLHTCAR